MNIAIIPARGGSKRIPRKNIKDLCGKPIIAYAIHAVQNFGMFRHLVVSLDDSELQTNTAACGQKHCFLRPFNWLTTSNVKRSVSLISSVRSASNLNPLLKEKWYA